MRVPMPEPNRKTNMAGGSILEHAVFEYPTTRHFTKYQISEFSIYFYYGPFIYPIVPISNQKKNLSKDVGYGC